MFECFHLGDRIIYLPISPFHFISLLPIHHQADKSVLSPDPDPDPGLKASTVGMFDGGDSIFCYSKKWAFRYIMGSFFWSQLTRFRKWMRILRHHTKHADFWHKRSFSCVALDLYIILMWICKLGVERRVKLLGWTIILSLRLQTKPKERTAKEIEQATLETSELCHTITWSRWVSVHDNIRFCGKSDNLPDSSMLSKSWYNVFPQQRIDTSTNK